MARRIVFGLLLLLAFSQVSAAQTAQLSHVFPQIVDGVQADGSSYVSLLFIVNQSSFGTTCTLSPYGVDSSRFHSVVVTLTPNTWQFFPTAGIGPLQTGYLRVNCSQFVQAWVNYRLMTPGIDAGGRPNLVVRGTATVFSAPTSAEVWLPIVSAFRTGVAIANDTDVAGAYQLQFTDAVTGAVTGITIHIPARSQYVRFVDEIVPGAAYGTFVIEANQGAVFNAMGLLFSGTSFSAVTTLN